MPIYVVLKSLGLLGSAPAREFFGPARNGDRRSIAEKMTWAEPPKFGRAIALWGLNKFPNRCPDGRYVGLRVSAYLAGRELLMRMFFQAAVFENAGTAANRTISPSARVGWARMASRSAV